MGYTGDDALVASNLQVFERGIEDSVGISHLLAAYEPLAAQMCCRGDIFVHHGVSPAPPVVALRHLLSDAVLQPVHGPRLTLGDIDGHAALQREEAPAVGLHA